MAGLNDIFTTGIRGLNVTQGAISTTSHNIANANTPGYSRQRAVIETTRPFGGMSKFDTCSAGQMGTGAQVTTIERIRNYFVDYQVRNETGTSGYYTNMNQTLSNIEGVFAEPSADSGLEGLITKFFASFQNAATPPISTDTKKAVVKQASTLADQINYAYNQLKKTSDDCQGVLETNVTDVNSYLDQVNELNKQIRGVSALGQAPNDLMDKRDYLIDELSNKFGIKLDRDSLDTINLSSTEYPDAALVKSDPNDNGYNRLSYVKSVDYIKKADGTYDLDANGAYKGITVEYYPLGNEKAPTQSFNIVTTTGASKATDNQKAADLVNQLNQNRILLSDKDGNAMVRTPSTTSGGVSSASVTLKDTPSPVTVSTSVTGAGVNTITVGSNTIVIDATGKVTTNAHGYACTGYADGSTSIVVDTGLTITVGKDGSISSKMGDLNNPTQTDLNRSMFETYQYESGINNVDSQDPKGEIAANQSVQDDIKSNMDCLDRMAEALAFTVNALQTGSITDGTTSNGLANNLIFINGDNTLSKTDTGITAENIKINGDLLSDSNKLNCNTTSTSGDGDGKRAAAIANLATLKLQINKIAAGTDLSSMTRQNFLTSVGIDPAGFSDTTTCLNLKAGTDGSTIDSYYKSMVNELGVEVEATGRIVDNQETILSKLQDDRSQESGVSLDEETTNLIQFQHAYQANAKVISTVNELLDVVINGLMK